MFPTFSHVRLKSTGVRGPGYGTLDAGWFDEELVAHFQGSTCEEPPLLQSAGLGTCTRIGPRWRVFEPPSMASQFAFVGQRACDQVNFFESVHQNEGVHRDLLLPLLTEAFAHEADTHRYDPARGNSLHLYGNESWLLTPGGLAANELYAFNVSRETPIPRTTPLFAFKTPILQITSSRVSIGEGIAKLLAVRTFNTVHFLSGGKASMDDHSWRPSFHEIGTITPKAEPMQISFNPVLGGEAAWICEDRSVHVWDLLSSPDDVMRRTRIIRNGDWMYESSRENDLKWKGIDYAWHPRILLLGEAKYLSILDLRSPSESSLPFFSIPSSTATFRGVITNPENPFQVGACSTETTYLIDSRYPAHPLLEWTTADPIDPPVGIQFITTGSQSALMTWNARHGEILVHPITSPPPHETPNPHDFTHSCANPPPHNRHRPHRLFPFHKQPHDPLAPRTSAIPFFHPEECNWGVNPGGARESSPRESEATASGGEESPRPGVRRRVQRELARRRGEEANPAWPLLVGVAVGAASAGRIKLFQGAADGAVYASLYRVKGDLDRNRTEVDEAEMAEEVDNLESSRKWMQVAEAAALQNNESAPHLRQICKTSDVTAYFKGISRMFIPDAFNPEEAQPADIFKCQAVAKKIIQDAVPKTLFEIQEAERNESRIRYSEKGDPILPHPRLENTFHQLDCLNAVLEVANTQFAASEQEDREESLPTNAALLALKAIEVAETMSADPLIKQKSVPLELLDRCEPGAENNVDPAFDGTLPVDVRDETVVRQLLSTSFVPSGEWSPEIPETLADETLDGGASVTEVLTDLKKNTLRGTLDWISKDVCAASTVIGSKHFSVEVPSKRQGPVQIEVKLDPSNTLESDTPPSQSAVEATIQSLLEDEGLNLPDSVTLHNPLLFSRAVSGRFKISKEAILLRDKWNHPDHWYSEAYEAKRRMMKQVSLVTRSRRENALKGGAAAEPEDEEVKKPKKSSGKVAFSQDDFLLRTQEKESMLMSSQTRVVARSSQLSQASQQVRMKREASQVASSPPRLVSSQSLVSSSPFVDVQGFSSQTSASLRASGSGSGSLPPSQSMSLPKGSLLYSQTVGSRFSLGVGSSSSQQPQKKKPRKSGF
ncbi:hypothetical protein BC830DRAFT_1137411 [Chytriomyces sp. MP71]|nr:hypothetical protein BC830DRAFT_1137411 [Chytriomyces sp. MP71]